MEYNRYLKVNPSGNNIGSPAYVMTPSASNGHYSHHQQPQQSQNYNTQDNSSYIPDNQFSHAPQAPYGNYNSQHLQKNYSGPSAYSGSYSEGPYAQGSNANYGTYDQNSQSYGNNSGYNSITSPQRQVQNNQLPHSEYYGSTGNMHQNKQYTPAGSDKLKMAANNILR